MTSTSGILRVHTDAATCVWHGQDGVRAECSHLGPEAFVETKLFRGAEHVRVLGTPENARLIVKMHEARVRRGKGKRPSHIQLGSPSICFRQRCLLDPAFVLQQLWQPATAAMLTGCWHELSDKDFPTYYMLAAFQTNGGRIDETIRRVATYHPAWPALSFPLTADLDVACRLICLIRDPRWYNHHNRPNRASRLLSYLGLTPQNFVVDRAVEKADQHRDRAELVLRAWGGDRPDPANPDEPRNFLWRIRKHVGGVRGWLKASHVHMQFVRLVWLQGLAPPGRQVFDPSIFFKHFVETEAFQRHLQRLRSV